MRRKWIGIFIIISMIVVVAIICHCKKPDMPIKENKTEMVYYDTTYTEVIDIFEI